MHYVLTRLKIKPGKEEEAEKFLRYLAESKRDEMGEMLAEAKIDIDCSFIDKHADGSYLYIFKKIDDIEHLKERIANSKLKLYEEIRVWMEGCLEERVDLEAHAAFETPGAPNAPKSTR